MKRILMRQMIRRGVSLQTHKVPIQLIRVKVKETNVSTTTNKRVNMSWMGITIATTTTKKNRATKMIGLVLMYLFKI